MKYSRAASSRDTWPTDFQSALNVWTRIPRSWQYNLIPNGEIFGKLRSLYVIFKLLIITLDQCGWWRKKIGGMFWRSGSEKELSNILRISYLFSNINDNKYCVLTRTFLLALRWCQALVSNPQNSSYIEIKYWNISHPILSHLDFRITTLLSVCFLFNLCNWNNCSLPKKPDTIIFFYCSCLGYWQ